MAHDDDERKDRIRESILRYIRSYPDAADTAAGIVAHWLPTAGFEDAPAVIDAVLDGLVFEGYLREGAELPGGTTLYVRGARR